MKPGTADAGGIAGWPARRPWAALAIALAAALAALFALRSITIDPSLEKMFASDDPAARAMVRVLNHFAAVDDLLILVTQPPQPLPDVEPLLAMARRFEQGARESPAAGMVERVSWRVDPQSRQFFEEVLVPRGIFYLSDEELARFRERLSPEQIEEQIERSSMLMAAPGPAAEALARAFLRDPLRLHEFVLDRLESYSPFPTFAGSDAFLSADGRSLLIRVTGRRPPSDLEFSRQFTEAMSGVAQEANSDQLELHISGSYAIAAVSERSIRRDMIASVVGSVLMLQVFFLLVFRRALRTFLLAFAPVALGVLYGFGGYGLSGHDLTPMTAVIGAILAGMGIDYTIHYIAHYRSLRAAAVPPAAAATGTTRSIGLALLAAWITSVFGFMAIGWSSVQAMRDFALLGALGLAGSLIGAVFVLPALVVVTGRRSAAPAATHDVRLNLQPLLAGVRRHARLLLIVMSGAAVMAAGVVALHGNEVLPLESDLTVMHPKPNPPLEAQRVIAQRMGSSPESLIVHLEANGPQDLLALAHAVQARLASARLKDIGISGSYGLATLLPDPELAPARAAAFSDADAQRVVNDLRAAVDRSVFDPAAVEPSAQFLHRLLTHREAPGVQALLPYEQLASSLLPRDAVQGETRHVTQAICLVMVSHPLTERAMRGRVINAVRQELADLPGATLTGLSVIGHDTETTVHRDLPRLMLAALGVVGLYLLLHFRSLIDAALSLLPTVFSLLCLAAFMHLSHARLNMVNLVSIPLLIGIAVDYGIFLVSHARWQHLAAATGASLPQRLAPTCQAIVISAITTTLGFSSLSLTSVGAIQSLGLTVGVGVLAALAAALLLLVPIFAIKSGGGRR